MTAPKEKHIYFQKYNFNNNSNKTSTFSKHFNSKKNTSDKQLNSKPNKFYNISKFNNKYSNPALNNSNLDKKSLIQLNISSVLPCISKDRRPYISITIKGREFLGLLDSGAQVSVLGNGSHQIFLDLGFNLESASHTVLTADGRHQDVIGIMHLPVKVKRRIRLTKFIVVPSISIDVILGIDFWNHFKLFSKLSHEISFVTSSGKPFELLPITSVSGLSTEQKERLDQVIKHFEDISYEHKGLGKTLLVQHKITTVGEPIKQRYYPLSPAKLKDLNKEIDRMLSEGIIQPSRSPWSNPLVLVTKKDGSLRVCLDSRKLNSVTVKDSYPLPYISRILSNLRDAKFLSSIDLSQSFFQILLEPSSREKTAFVVPGRGLFEFIRMPFGITNAPAELQRLSDTLFGPELDDNIMCFLDDLILISKDFDSHISLLEKVHLILKNAGLTINLKKSEFCKERLKYLGYVVDKDGLHTDPAKLEIIKNFPRPKSVKNIRSFIGMCSYYRRFIPNFSDVVAPLARLTGGKRGVKINFTWTDLAEQSFIKLKEALISAPVLQCPDFSKPFFVHCDASSYAVGSVLMQEDDDGHSHPIAYFSKLLSKAEQNYSVTERELLAVLLSIEHFRPYIEGTEFNVITDHASLKWLLNLTNPSGRLARWATRLSQYNFKITHKKGANHTVPDALSRIEISPIFACPDSIYDPWYINMFNNCQKYPNRFKTYKVIDEVLYKYIVSKNPLKENLAWKIVIPRENVIDTIRNNHDNLNSGHFGIHKTLEKLKLHYFWPRMFNDVKEYINKCEICKAYKHSNSSPLGLMTNPKLVDRPMLMLSIDLIGPLPKSYTKHLYILSVVDFFTKFCWIFPLRKATTQSIVSVLEKEIFLKFGVPKILILDNGPQFVSKNFKTFAKNYNIPKLFYNSLYTPQNNPIERYNKTIETCLACYVGTDHRTWSKFLPHVQAAINGTVNLVTGFTPNFLLFGRELIIDGTLYQFSSVSDSSEIVLGERPIYAQSLNHLANVFKVVIDKLAKSYLRNAKYYNKNRKSTSFVVGDSVWRRNFVHSNAAYYFSSKLAPKFVKCKVVSKLSDNIYLLRDFDKRTTGKYHVKDILKI